MRGNVDVLSERYATNQMNAIFSAEGGIRLERDLWISVMDAERALGVPIPAEVIEKYRAARNQIDLNRIKEIELKTRHDVKAKIQAFSEAAGVQPKEQVVHWPLTSRDMDDNVWQTKIRRASDIALGKSVSVLKHFLDKARKYEDLILVARTHMQPAQLTTLGRRMSMWGEELLGWAEEFDAFKQDYPLRGIKGPVGTQSDLLKLLGSEAKVAELEQMVAADLGFSRVLSSPGQVYPRSMDYAVLSRLTGLSAGMESFSNTIRLMARNELATEGFKPGQVGSSAMPYKMNTRSAERIRSFANALKMYAMGASLNSGDQWEEGDVADSLLRRIIIPGAFYAADGLCETTLTVLNEMGPYPEVINREVDRYLPFVAMTELMSVATKAGMGREVAHEKIRKHAVAAALAMRQGQEPRLVERLAKDPGFSRYGIDEEGIREMMRDREHFIGTARSQIREVAKKADPLIAKYDTWTTYEPQPIL